MLKGIIEAENIYSQGHEQGGKRPYLVCYDGNDYILGFAFTTKAKIEYSSHKNLEINGRADIMTIDNFQLIYKKNFTKPASNFLYDCEYSEVIDSFVNQIISDKNTGWGGVSCFLRYCLFYS